MRIIGLTGGIASGKSLVSQQLAEKGAVVIDADKLGHETYRQGVQTYRSVVHTFGEDVVGPDGEIDRKALGAKVFGEPELRHRLQQIVWPAIRDLAAQRLAELRKQGTGVAVLEAAVLIEADWVPLVDEVWLVEVSPETARQRLMARNALTPEEAESRLQAQLTNEKRRPFADVVIENDGSLDELRSAVDEAWSKLETRVGS
ncbi:MAG: dephospho-CoA kinase [Dehalococcoidia bacterium]